jgi:hypothetical protein
MKLASAHHCGRVFKQIALVTLAVLTLWTAPAFGGQSDNQPPESGEGSLLYRSPISGRYEAMPLVHTDAALDVRGLVAAATVTSARKCSSGQRGTGRMVR